MLGQGVDEVVNMHGVINIDNKVDMLTKGIIDNNELSNFEFAKPSVNKKFLSLTYHARGTC